jgi:hypothetical protein
MRILVEKVDGSKEVITLVPPVEIVDGPEFKLLHHFHCGDGMDYYFDAQTGTYDGWGMGMCGSEEEAQAHIKRIEEGREPAEGL